MRIIGIDPGTRISGYGVVDLKDGKIRPVAMGAWELKAPDLAGRLACLWIEYRRVLDAFSPTHLCIELPFIAENARSALVLGSARGVLLAESSMRGMLISEKNATWAKKVITGDGYASKKWVCECLLSLLELKEKPKFLDATDALALATAWALIEGKTSLKETDSSALALWNKEVKAQKRSSQDKWCMLSGR
jgi:crossover junction endodeoxyribonuclease RuvC